MKRYFAYIRVSTVKQGERGSSLQEQRSAIEVFAERNNLRIAEWFEERETAAKKGRRLFTTMIARLSRGQADGIIIHKIDRGARNPYDWAKLGELIDRGVDVQFVHDNVDLRSRGGRLSADIQAVIAADYVRNLRDEVKKGFYGRLKQGFYPLPAPTGYLNRGGGQKKELDPVMAPLVRQAFELYATNNMSLGDLHAELMRRGLESRRGRAMSPSALAKLLHNPFYMGIVRIARTKESFAGCHEPLITKALFDRVQAVLAGKAHGKVIKHELAFRRLIKCAACGRHLTGERKKGRYVYYRCFKPKCRKAVATEQAIAEAIQSALGRVRLSEEELGDMRDLAEGLQEEAAAGSARITGQIELQLTKCNELLVRLTDALLDGRVSKDVFDERRLASLRDRQGLMDRLAVTRSEQAPAQTVLNYFELPVIKQTGCGIPLPSEMRQIAESICSNFIVDGKKPAITLKSPYREIANWRETTNCGPYGGTLRTLLDALIEVAECQLVTPENSSRQASATH